MVSIAYVHTLFLDGSVQKSLQETYGKKLHYSCSTDIVDVYCGKEYRKHSSLTSPNNISLTLNTDGVAIFRSSKCSLWPVWLVINELQPSER